MNENEFYRLLGTASAFGLVWFLYGFIHWLIARRRNTVEQAPQEDRQQQRQPERLPRQ